MDYQNIILTGLAAVSCVILAVLLKGNKAVLLQTVTRLVQEAEAAINGCGMGEEKKRWVIAQLQASGVEVTKWLDCQIDVIVEALNAKGAWLGQQLQKGADGRE